jgi:hypothetical protein
MWSTLRIEFIHLNKPAPTVVIHEVIAGGELHTVCSLNMTPIINFSYIYLKIDEC